MENFLAGRPLFYDRQGQPMKREDYATAKYESDDYRRIGQDILVVDGEPINISTVWLGIDHNMGGPGVPIIFETMIFGGAHDGQLTRYATESAAQEGHMRTVADLAAGEVPWFARGWDLSDSPVSRDVEGEHDG